MSENFPALQVVVPLIAAPLCLVVRHLLSVRILGTAHRRMAFWNLCFCSGLETLGPPAGVQFSDDRLQGPGSLVQGGG